VPDSRCRHLVEQGPESPNRGELRGQATYGIRTVRTANPSAGVLGRPPPNGRAREIVQPERREGSVMARRDPSTRLAADPGRTATSGGPR
jgi:hypothetical protein